MADECHSAGLVDDSQLMLLHQHYTNVQQHHNGRLHSACSALTDAKPKARPFLRCGAEGAALLYGEAILRCTRGHRPLGDNHSWPRVLLNQPKSC